MSNPLKNKKEKYIKTKPYIRLSCQKRNKGGNPMRRFHGYFPHNLTLSEIGGRDLKKQNMMCEK